MPSEPQQERPSTYFVEDKKSEAERQRVTIQDRLITAGMGGALPEQTDPSHFHHILDVGCGTGNWLIEVAQTYPHMKLLVGVDVSKHMVEYAQEQARAAGVNDRVEFHVMDATRMIEFPKEYFDLVNQRLGWSYLRTWDWPRQLTEYQRVARLNGVIRVTEGDVFGDSNSPALNQFYIMAREASFRSGRVFAAARDGVTRELPRLLHQHGLMDVQRRAVMLEYRSGTPEHAIFVEDLTLFFRTLAPFFRKWTRVPDDYEALCQQALLEMKQPDFVATWEMVTVWGTRALNNMQSKER
ncbi:MAG: hypothetical protein PVS3B1_04300 [Ktedonobacteraceae bacterium]